MRDLFLRVSPSYRVIVWSTHSAFWGQGRSVDSHRAWYCIRCLNTSLYVSYFPDYACVSHLFQLCFDLWLHVDIALIGTVNMWFRIFLQSDLGRSANLPTVSNWPGYMFIKSWTEVTFTGVVTTLSSWQWIVYKFKASHVGSPSITGPGTSTM